MGSSFPGTARAGAPKALGECLVRYLAAELAADGVRVNTIVAGALDTNAFRAVLGDPTDHLARISSKSLHGRPISFDDVVGAVRFLISSDGAMVQGQTLVGSHAPTSMAALTKTERLESLHRNDRSTITPPTPTSRTQIRPGTHGASRHTITPNLSTLNLT
jgi:hypothetical protein